MGVDRKRRRGRRLGAWLVTVALIVAGYLFIWPFGLAVIVGWTLFAAVILALSHRYMNDPGAVPVLVYHSVTGDGRWLPWSHDISLSPEAFERHLKTLKAMGCTVLKTADLVHARRDARPLPPKSAVIHLDDGYLDNWVAAYPLLKRHGLPATIFVSSDFIEPGDSPRPNLDDVAAGRCRWEDLGWAGYLNAAEMKVMEASGLITIESHGASHSRVYSGPRVVNCITPENWRSLAWVQWRRMPGEKWDWYRQAKPSEVPYGSKVRENQSALAVREWSDSQLEPEDAFVERLQKELEEPREILSGLLGRSVEIFCWPFNERASIGHSLALANGYLAATGGRGENRPNEDPTEISRISVAGQSFGWRSPVLQALTYRAQVRVGQGNYYWYLLVLPSDQWIKLKRQVKTWLEKRTA